jgi:hypothetical protein
MNSRSAPGPRTAEFRGSGRHVTAHATRQAESICDQLSVQIRCSVRSAPSRIRTYAHGSGGREPYLANCAVYLPAPTCYRSARSRSFRVYSGSWSAAPAVTVAATLAVASARCRTQAHRPHRLRADRTWSASSTSACALLLVLVADAAVRDGFGVPGAQPVILHACGQEYRSAGGLDCEQDAGIGRLGCARPQFAER